MGLFKRKLLIIKHIYANNIPKNIFYSNMLNLVSDFDFSHTSVHYLLPCLFSIPDIQKNTLQGSFGFLQGILGGEKGIRTLGPQMRSTVFETAPFDHSGISPYTQNKMKNSI